jgi:transposase
VLTSGANVADISRALDLLDGSPSIAGRRGHPRRRFQALLADKGYDSDAFRQACRERGTEPIIPKRKTTGVKGLGKLRYVVEQTLCAARRSVVSPVQPGGTRREVPGLTG